MKMNMTINTWKRVSLLLLFSIISLGNIQAGDYKKYISKYSATLNKEAQTATINMQIELPSDIISKDQSLIIVPVVTSSSGKIREELSPILFIGRQWAPYYHRARNLQSHSDYLATTPYATRTLGKEVQPVDYQATFAYQEGDKVTLHFVVQDCCDKHELGTVDLLVVEPKPEPQPLAPIVVTSDQLTPFIAAKPELEKHRDEEVVVRVQFKWDDDAILTDYMNNRAELDRIKKLLDPILTQSNIYTIDQSNITGYASPEGGAVYNQSLSERRAKSLLSYITSIYPSVKLGKLNIIGHGDDWDGLVEAIENANIANGKELIEIIKNKSDVKERKQLLARNGSYEEILQNLYPALRRTVINVKYVAKGLSQEEAKRLFFSRPKDLSVYEAYNLLDELKAQHSLLELHKIIADSHPTSVVAQVNYSTLLLQQQKADEALQVLRRIEHDSSAFNNIAVCYIIKEQFTTAREYLSKAPKSELTTKNLKMIEGR